MALIKEVRGFKPEIGTDCFLAETAVIIGDVVIGKESSIWYNAVIRGDVNSIKIGHSVNIQDGAVIHCTYKKAATIIGNEVSVGHNAMIHGCIIEDRVLIGMGAIVMDNAYIPSGTLIAAGAVVTEGSKLESGFIYAGIPAKKLKALDKDQFEFSITRTADNYKMYAGWYKED